MPNPSSSNNNNHDKSIIDFLQLCENVPRNKKFILSPVTTSHSTDCFIDNTSVDRNEALGLLFNLGILNKRKENEWGISSKKPYSIVNKIQGVTIARSREKKKKFHTIEVSPEFANNKYNKHPNEIFKQRLLDHKNKLTEQNNRMRPVPSQSTTAQEGFTATLSSASTPQFLDDSEVDISLDMPTPTPPDATRLFETVENVVSPATPNRSVTRSDTAVVSPEQAETNTDSNLTFTVNDLLEFFGKSYSQEKAMKRVPNVTRLPKDGDLDKSYRWKKLRQYYQDFVEAMLGTLEEQEARDYILHGLLESLTKLSGEDTEEKVKSKLYDKLTGIMSDLIKKAPRSSLEKRILRATLIKSLSVKERQRLQKLHDVGLGLSGPVRCKGYADYNQMAEGKELQKTTYHRQKKPDKTLEDVVSFILQHVKLNSWGTKTIKLDKDEVYENFPKLTRMTTRASMWKEYSRYTRRYRRLQKKAKKAKYKHLRKTKQYKKCASKIVDQALFYKIVSEITSYDPKILKAVDYVSCRLVSEPCEMLQSIVERCVEAGNERKKLEQHISHIQHFLKHCYKQHASKNDDDDCHHGLEYGLNNSSSNSNSSENPKESTCCGCKYPFYALNLIKEEVLKNKLGKPKPMIDDAMKAIQDIRKKFIEYMKHMQRIRAQQIAIDNRLKKLRQECIDTGGKGKMAHLIADYKMKYEPTQQIEPTIDHYSKRGLGWHGFLLIYYVLREETQDDGSIAMVPKRINVYYDQIMKEGTPQDAAAVVSFIEASLVSITDQFAFIKEVTVQSDNAKCYQSSFLIFGIIFLNKVFENRDIKVCELFHTETQDGKSQLDAHFAQANSYLKSYLIDLEINKIKRIMTGDELASALSSKAGMTNCIVQTVSINDEVLAKMKKVSDKVVQECNLYFSRVNHVYFDTRAKLSEYEEASSFNMDPKLRGWARRHDGDIYGDDYIHEFDSEILQIYGGGMRSKNNKKNAREIRAIFVEKHQNRFTIPSATAIKQHLSTFAADEKSKRLTLENIDKKVGKTRRYRVLDELETKYMKEAVYADVFDKPETMWKRWVSLIKSERKTVTVKDKELKGIIKYEIEKERKRVTKKARACVVNGFW